MNRVQLGFKKTNKNTVQQVRTEDGENYNNDININNFKTSAQKNDEGVKQTAG